MFTMCCRRCKEKDIMKKKEREDDDAGVYEVSVKRHYSPLACSLFVRKLSIFPTLAVSRKQERIQLVSFTHPSSTLWRMLLPGIGINRDIKRRIITRSKHLRGIPRKAYSWLRSTYSLDFFFPLGFREPRIAEDHKQHHGHVSRFQDLFSSFWFPSMRRFHLAFL